MSASNTAASTSDTVASTSNTATGRYLRLPDVLSETGLGKTTIYHLIGEGAFPKPVKISSRAVAWREGAIEAWKAARQAQPE